MEWLIAHEDELNSEPDNTGPTYSAGPTPASINQPQTTPTNAAKSTKSEADGNLDTSKNPSKDGENKVEETMAGEVSKRKLTVEEAQKLMVERQAIRVEEERKKAIEDELKRREVGQKMLETRQQLQDQERIHLAQQIRREKIEKEAHRKRVLEQIAHDREAMKARSSNTAVGSETVKPTQSPTTAEIQTKNKTPASECRLALRFPDGSSKMQKFSPQEQLSAVRLFVQLEKSYAQTGNIEFVAPPNTKLSDPQMDETLDSLGLCPASRLEVRYNFSAYEHID